MNKRNIAITSPLSLYKTRSVGDNDKTRTKLDLNNANVIQFREYAILSDGSLSRVSS